MNHDIEINRKFKLINSSNRSIVYSCLLCWIHNESYGSLGLVYSFITNNLLDPSCILSFWFHVRYRRDFMKKGIDKS